MQHMVNAYVPTNGAQNMQTNQQNRILQ